MPPLETCGNTYGIVRLLPISEIPERRLNVNETSQSSESDQF